MSRREYTGVFKKEDKWIIAWIEEVPGVITQGRTMEEARENLQDALSLMLEVNKDLSEEEGLVLREPVTVMVA